MADDAGEKPSLYKSYMRVMNKIGDYQGRGILIVLYFTVFLLPGSLLSAFGDRLHIKHKPTSWVDRTDQEATIERSREQW